MGVVQDLMMWGIKKGALVIDAGELREITMDDLTRLEFVPDPETGHMKYWLKEKNS